MLLCPSLHVILKQSRLRQFSFIPTVHACCQPLRLGHDSLSVAEKNHHHLKFKCKICGWQKLDVLRWGGTQTGTQIHRRVHTHTQKPNQPLILSRFAVHLFDQSHP